MASTSAESPLVCLPYSGEYHSAAQKLYPQTILFVPFYKAKKSALNKHVEFVNDLGFDCVTFNLEEQFKGLQSTIFSSHNQLGLKHIWADQIEQMLNAIPGKKIVYSFSNPSAASIEAISRRHAADICGLICDSGPSANLFQSLVNYYTYEEPISFFPIKMLTAAAATLSWNIPIPGTTVSDDLKKIPAGFPVLSVRGWKDKLMSAQDIDQVFEPHPHLNWRKLSLPKAGHLDGLKHFAGEYEPGVANFLHAVTFCN